MQWLIAPDEAERLEAILKRPIVGSISASKREARAMDRDGDTAVIHVRGALVPEREAAFDFFDVEQTAYSDIKKQVATANGGAYSRIVLDVNSSGGYADGLYEAMGAVADSKIPVTALVSGTAASAAYMLASQAGGGIHAAHDAAMVGSIGVATSAQVSKYSTDIANTDSPKKRPNASTEEGVSVIREELDDIYGVFAERIAAGRNVTADIVKTGYGQGAMMTARKALSMKMIDGIGKLPGAKQPAQREVKKMDYEKLKAEHADVFNAVFAAGVKAERGRVEAHLMMADSSGDNKTAREAIKAGDGLTEEIQAKHLCARINKSSIDNRSAEAPAAVVPMAQAPGATPNPAEAERKAFEAKYPAARIQWGK